MVVFFFFNDTATTEIYTLSLHDALPICSRSRRGLGRGWPRRSAVPGAASAGRGRRTAAAACRATRSRHGRRRGPRGRDRKSTRLNSSHANISYAVFCLKKKKKNIVPML